MFKIGDKVRITDSDMYKHFIGMTGTVVCIHSEKLNVVGVDFGKSYNGTWHLDRNLSKPTGRYFNFNSVEKVNTYEVDLI